MVSFDDFAVNRIFPTKDVLLEMVEKLKKLDAALVRCTNSSRQVVLKCRHGIQRKSLCTGARPNQSFNFCGCPIRISISLQKNLQWQVVYSNLKHDFQAVGEEVDATYPENRRLTTEEIDEVKMLQKDFSLSNAAIAQALSKKNRKNYSSKADFQSKIER